MQGVWYRGATQKKAKELGIVGFVKNEMDGSVYAELEGEENKLRELIDWCKKGPELAIVKKVETEEGNLQGFISFDILR